MTNDLEVEEAAERAARRFADAAWERHALDVAYAMADSPFGSLLVAVTPKGLVRLAYPNERPDDVLEDLASRVSPRVLESPKATDPVRRELDEYFEGERRRFGTKVDYALIHGFTEDVLRETSRIPFGSIRTYREVATGAGRPAAVRAAGNARWRGRPRRGSPRGR